MDPQAKKMSIEKLSEITDVLENLVSQGYGPQGRQTLMSTSTGQVTVTNSGCFVLNALHFAHPVAKMIVESINKMASFTGDGSKTTVLYLNNFLQQAKVRGAMTGGVTISRNVQLFQREVYPKLVKVLLQYSEMLDLSKKVDESEERIKSVFRNVLFPQYSVKRVEGFSMLLTSALNDASTACDFWNRLDLLINNFDSFVIELPGLPYGACRVMELFVLQRNFATLHQVKFEKLENIKFVMCTCPVENSMDQDAFSETVSVSSNSDFTKFMQFQRMRVEKFAKCCSKHSISIVLSTEKVLDFALEIFTSHNVSVIHCVLEEDISFLECLLGKQAIVDMDDLIEESNICETKQCKTIILNGRKCVHLVLDSAKHNLPKMLLVASPTRGLCDQLSLMLKRCLKSLYLCNIEKFVDPEIIEVHKGGKIASSASLMSEYPFVVTLSGGGCFEILCHDFLMEYSKTIENSDLAEFCSLLGEALLYCPRLLHKNNNISPENLCKDFIEKFNMTRLEQKATRSSNKKMVHFGVDRRGNVKDMAGDGLVEPLSVKLYIFSGFLQLLQTLSRIDNIVGVKRK